MKRREGPIRLSEVRCLTCGGQALYLPPELTDGREHIVTCEGDECLNNVGGESREEAVAAWRRVNARFVSLVALDLCGGVP